MNLSEELRRQQTEMKLGSVTGLNNDGTAIIRFDEDTAASGKNYSYLNSYIPKQGDRVLLAPMGNTYIILGAILFEESPQGGGGGVSEEKVREIAGDLDSGVLTTVSDTYLTKTSASNTYLTKTSASNTYLTKTDASTGYATKTHSHTEYAPSEHTHDKLTYKSGSTEYTVTLNSSQALIPKTSGAYYLGTSTYKWKEAHVSNNATIGSASTSSSVSIGGGAIKTGGNSAMALAFFNGTPRVKQSIAKLTGTTVPVAKVNEIITALANYGLISTS